MKRTIAQIVELWKSDRLSFWILSTLAAVAIYCVGRYFDFSKQDAASWIQAIGSIAAIAASVYIVNQQNLAERRRADEEALRNKSRFLHAVATTALHSQETAETFINHCFDQNQIQQLVPKPWVRTLGDTYNQICSIPAFDSPAPAISASVMSIRQFLRELIATQDQNKFASGVVFEHPMNLEVAELFLSSIKGATEQIFNEMRRCDEEIMKRFDS